MAGKEVIYETFLTKAPGSEALRKTAMGRLKHLSREGWHEMERESVGMDSVRVRFEREAGTRPLPPLRTKPEPPPKRQGRGGFGGGRGGPGGGPGGGRGGGYQGRGGPGGPPGRGGPPSQTPPAGQPPAQT